MIAVDTNVLARVSLRDDAKQAAIAETLLRMATIGEGLYISFTVCLELVWILRIKKLSREQIAAAIEKLLAAPGTLVGQRDLIVEALSHYKQGKADFADYVLYCESRRAGILTLASFDQVLCDEGYAIHPQHVP